MDRPASGHGDLPRNHHGTRLHHNILTKGGVDRGETAAVMTILFSSMLVTPSLPGKNDTVALGVKALTLTRTLRAKCRLGSTHRVAVRMHRGDKYESPQLSSLFALSASFSVSRPSHHHYPERI